MCHLYRILYLGCGGIARWRNGKIPNHAIRPRRDCQPVLPQALEHVPDDGYERCEAAKRTGVVCPFYCCIKRDLYFHQAWCSDACERCHTNNVRKPLVDRLAYRDDNGDFGNLGIDRLRFNGDCNDLPALSWRGVWWSEALPAAAVLRESTYDLACDMEAGLKAYFEAMERMLRPPSSGTKSWRRSRSQKKSTDSSKRTCVWAVADDRQAASNQRDLMPKSADCVPVISRSNTVIRHSSKSQQRPIQSRTADMTNADYGCAQRPENEGSLRDFALFDGPESYERDADRTNQGMRDACSLMAAMMDIAHRPPSSPRKESSEPQQENETTVRLFPTTAAASQSRFACQSLQQVQPQHNRSDGARSSTLPILPASLRMTPISWPPTLQPTVHQQSPNQSQSACHSQCSQ